MIVVLYCIVRVIIFVLLLYMYYLSNQVYTSCGVFLLYCVNSRFLELCFIVDGPVAGQPYVCFSCNQTKVILLTSADGLRVTSKLSLS